MPINPFKVFLLKCKNRKPLCNSLTQMTYFTTCCSNVRRNIQYPQFIGSTACVAMCCYQNTSELQSKVIVTDISYWAEIYI